MLAFSYHRPQPFVREIYKQGSSTHARKEYSTTHDSEARVLRHVQHELVRVIYRSRESAQSYSLETSNAGDIDVKNPGNCILPVANMKSFSGGSSAIQDDALIGLQILYRAII